jgi:hypothetical protein
MFDLTLVKRAVAVGFDYLALTNREQTNQIPIYQISIRQIPIQSIPIHHPQIQHSQSYKFQAIKPKVRKANSVKFQIVFSWLLKNNEKKAIKCSDGNLSGYVG